jgi:hypothetical protein
MSNKINAVVATVAVIAAQGAWLPDGSGGEFWATPEKGESPAQFHARVKSAWDLEEAWQALESACRDVAAEIGEESPERGMQCAFFAHSLTDWWGQWSSLASTTQALERLGAYSYWEDIFPEFVRRGAAAAAAVAAERAAK